MAAANRENRASDGERRIFDLYLRTGRRAVPIELKFNLYHDPANGQFTFGPGGGSAGGRSASRGSAAGGGSARGGAGSSGPRLTPQAKAVADKIARDFYLRTGKKVQVNSGTRSPEGQAEAMLGNRRNWGIYKDRQAVSEIRSAFDRTGNDTRVEQVAAMGQVIRQQVSRGVYISDHLRSNALDFRVLDLSPHERFILVEVSCKHSKKVLNEHLPEHVHVKY